MMYPGHFLGVGYVKMFMPNATLDGFIPPFIGLIFGWWIGEVVGCWPALGLLRYRSAARTAKLLAMLTPVGIFFWVRPEEINLLPPLLASLLTIISFFCINP
ncbi:MAG: hypothetical protein ACKO9I_02700 [Sphaerospermopsis kisseleviana]|nr:hypothetical protein [Sphaerospermopsis sp.]